MLAALVDLTLLLLGVLTWLTNELPTPVRHSATHITIDCDPVPHDGPVGDTLAPPPRPRDFRRAVTRRRTATPAAAPSILKCNAAPAAAPLTLGLTAAAAAAPRTPPLMSPGPASVSLRPAPVPPPMSAVVHVGRLGRIRLSSGDGWRGTSALLVLGCFKWQSAFWAGLFCRGYGLVGDWKEQRDGIERGLSRAQG